MKKRTIIIIAILSIIVIGSVFSIYYLLENMDGIDNIGKLASLLYIPIVILIIALAILISILFNIRIKRNEQISENRLRMWNTITYKVKKAGETAFNELPIGIIVIDNNYKVMWANNEARGIFLSPLEKINIKDLSLSLFEQMQKEAIDEKGRIIFKSNIYGEIYQVEYLVNYNVLYFTNINEYEKLNVRYQNRMTAIGYINIDNLEEALSNFDVQERAEYQGKIIGAIAKWAESFKIFVRAYSESRYMIAMDYEQLLAVVDNNFTILDDVKVILRTSRVIRITLSIGIACEDININDLASDAQEQLELALYRGGDQAVVKINDKVSFFGAKTDPIQKESKVEIRNKSQELQDLIRSSSQVYTIGHRNLDADGFAATLAIYRLAKAMGKPAYIILDPQSIDTTVEKIFETIRQEYYTLLEDIVTPSKAIAEADSNSLLMIVDCQTDYQIVDSKLLKRFDKIGIIDHHRKGSGAIPNPKFYYTQTAASSSVELIFELLEFYEGDLGFNDLEATWMLLGIVVDTNNFVYRTSSITFEIAAIIKRYGADMNIVKKYLKEDFTEKAIRNNFLINMLRYNDSVAIAYAKDDLIYDRATLAKVSDELISITGIELGVTVGYIGDNEVGLSARSLGSINCQVIMERMGGGGHLNNAAAQRKGETVEEVVELLKAKIDSYLVEEEIMKIILVKDVKGKGKKGDILEVTTGHGNFLIRSGSAVVASVENIKALEKEQQDLKNKAEKLMLEMRELKRIIESEPIKIAVKVGNDGKLYGSVNTKQIADKIEEVHNIKVDKRKINLPSPLTILGEHSVTVQLHKEVLATVHIFLVENK